MIRTKRFLRLLVFVVLVFLLGGCGQVEEPETATDIPPTETPIPPTETPIPPTETLVPPTETPLPPTETPTPEPTEELVEYPVTDFEDMVGTWLPEKFGSLIFVITEDGVGIVKDKSGMVADRGQIHFEGDVGFFPSEHCTKPDASGTSIIEYSCTGQYKIFLTKSGDTPVYLRFELIEDENDQRKGLLSQNLLYSDE